jgi:hypothetical protein
MEETQKKCDIASEIPERRRGLFFSGHFSGLMFI